MKLCFFLKDTDNIIVPEPGVKCTQKNQIREQNDFILHRPQQNIHKFFTHQESLELKRVDGLNYVVLINYHESEN